MRYCSSERSRGLHLLLCRLYSLKVRGVRQLATRDSRLTTPQLDVSRLQRGQKNIVTDDGRARPPTSDLPSFSVFCFLYPIIFSDLRSERVDEQLGMAGR